MNDEPADLAARIERLADQLADSADLTDPRWRQALHEVPRHLFVPDVAWADPNDQEPNGYPVDRAADPERWWEAVCTDTVLVTQVDDGRGDVRAGPGNPSSSNSAPAVVFSILAQLEVHDHQRVLDIGTGTGWTAALLSWRLGAGNVTTVEIDPALAGQAQKNLQAAGYQPGLIIADGAQGHRAGARYDRVHVTCAVERVPWAWIDQTRPGGVIVAPYTPGYAFGHLARLVVTGHGTAVGRFPQSAGFMMMRSQRHLRGEPASFIHHQDEAAIFSTFLDPRTLGWESARRRAGHWRASARLPVPPDRIRRRHRRLHVLPVRDAHAERLMGARRISSRPIALGGHAVRAAPAVGRGGRSLLLVDRSRPARP